MATVADFRGAFPAFNDAAKFPDLQIQFYLTLGVKLHNVDRWGDLLDFGVMLWTAHNVSLDYESRKQAQVGQSPGTIRGAVTGMSADGVSWQRDASGAMNPGAGHWNLTQYGVRWRDLAMMMGAGPVQVGVPSEVELALSDWPWPGVT